jgi:hypothetical protein
MDYETCMHDVLDQLGPQQLKYMTVRRDSSALFSLSLLVPLNAELFSKAVFEKSLALTCFEEVESLKDLIVESHFEL